MSSGPNADAGETRTPPDPTGCPSLPTSADVPHERLKSEAKACRGASCKTPVIWANNPKTGKPIPLDSRAPVYRVEMIDGKLTAVRDRGAFVTHFATCKDAAQFGALHTRRETR